MPITLPLRAAVSAVSAPPPPPPAFWAVPCAAPEAQLSFADGATRTFDFVVGADGVGSAVRDALEAAGDLKVQRYEDDNVRIYKTIPLHLPDDWRKDVNYSCRTGNDLNLDALPTPEGLIALGLSGAVVQGGRGGGVERVVSLCRGARQAVDGLWTEVCGQQKQSNDPGNNQHILNTPIIGRR